MPFFSIIIPSYNRSTRLLHTIHSILNQTFLDYEVVVVDDGGHDNTEELIAALNNKKIRYFKTINQERAKARNFGLKQAQGKYVNYFDSDDVMYPDRLQIVYDFIFKNSHPSVLFTHFHSVDSQGKILYDMSRHYKSFAKDILFNNFLAAGSVFVERSVALQNLFHDDPRIITAEDWELWLRVYVNHDFIECKEKTFGLTQHPQRSLETISKERVTERDEYFAALVKNNNQLMTKYGRSAINLFRADRMTFIGLTQVMAGEKMKTVHYLTKAFLYSPRVVIRKRFWATARKLVM